MLLKNTTFWIRLCLLGSAFLLIASHVARGQAPPPVVAEPVRDNSFLIEEAFNQPAGVVQHVMTIASPMDGGLTFTFSEEWPLGGMRHQGAYSIPVVRASVGGLTGLGDVGLHYRYQLLGVEDGPWFVAPRLSVMFPTGDARLGMGAGGLTLETMLPVSVERAPFTLNANLGFAITPSARTGIGAVSRDVALRAAGSAIWAATRTLNLLVEASMDQASSRIGSTLASRERELTVSPGIRWAQDLPGGMQIVRGVAMPIRIAAGRAERNVFAYLSIEHSFHR
jgi:hypothetical protein